MNHDLSTRQGQINHYAAVRARIAAASYKTPTMAPKRVSSQEWTQRPQWMREDTSFDWHVMSFKVHDRTSAHIKWLRKRCPELGVTYAQMIGRRGNDKIAGVRVRLYHEMKFAFPHLSLPQIGRAFGGRDHTSVLSGIRRWEKVKNEND